LLEVRGGSFRLKVVINLFQESATFSTVEAGLFAGGGLSSDLGPVLLRGIDLQIGVTVQHEQCFKKQLYTFSNRLIML